LPEVLIAARLPQHMGTCFAPSLDQTGSTPLRGCQRQMCVRSGLLSGILRHIGTPNLFKIGFVEIFRISATDSEISLSIYV
jgi:hypothetical protein